MDKPTILKMLVWLRRRKYSKNSGGMTQFDLFTAAFKAHFHIYDEESRRRIACDMDAFEDYGSVPMYLSLFVRAQCTVSSQPEGDRSCISAQ